MPPTHPAYLALAATGELEARAAAAVRSLASCEVCPRNCRIDRLADEVKVCATGRHARVSSHFPHFGEEDCLRGEHGSGTIFFAFCNLKCVFCQNHDTSQAGAGREVTAEGLAAMMLELQALGCHNVNLVTPEHVVPEVLEALVVAVRGGLRLPLVYNTSGYDSLGSLRLLDGVVDVYMPDFKLWSPAAAARYLKAKDYPEVARAALREMHRQVGALVLDEAGLGRRGVLVRHLVMPGLLEESAAIFRFLAELSPDTYVNVMDQYRPEYRASAYPEIDRRPTAAEMERAYALARAAGLHRFDVRDGRPRLRRRFAYLG
ncbi:MAG: radical SAM protein [Polyangiaceae bacterium]|nr:radical SAM protein [Polyangiaceae bacterium]